MITLCNTDFAMVSLVIGNISRDNGIFNETKVIYIA